MEKITIEFFEERPDEYTWQGWRVSQGEKYADGLAFDEMLGLIACLTVPEARHPMNWMKTKEDHKAAQEAMALKPTTNQVNTEIHDTDFEDVNKPI